MWILPENELKSEECYYNEISKRYNRKSSKLKQMAVKRHPTKKPTSHAHPLKMNYRRNYGKRFTVIKQMKLIKIC
jgi:hypothetical protein